MILAFVALFTQPAAVLAQAASLPRVAILFIGTPEVDKSVREAFVQGMRERGYENGKNVLIDEASVNGRYDRLPQAVGELLGRKPAVIIVAGSQAARAAKAATSSVPIVVATMGDPVAQGFAASLARPGGNLTGNYILSVELGVKRLELLKEILPKAAEIGFLGNDSNPGTAGNKVPLDAAAKRLGIRISHMSASNEAELDKALASLPGRRLDALLVGGDALSSVFRAKIVESLARSRIPAMHSFGRAADDGGLASYAASVEEFFRNVASFVDRILKGAKPGDLPIEQPSKFELVINLKAAKALGITVPQAVLLRADRVIE